MKQFRDTQYFVTEDGKLIRNNKELSFSISNKGYKTIDTFVNGVRKKYNLHRMVAQLYVDNPNDHCCVNHIDGNKLNNHYSNLEWVTLKQNSQHSVRVLHKQVGENHSQAKVPNKIVSYIKKCKKFNKIPNFDRLSKSYGVGVQHLKNIYKGYKRLLA
jgi:hypothetical protein